MSTGVVKRPTGAELEWVGRILWGDEAACAPIRRGWPVRADARYAVLSVGRRPRLLVPLSSRRAAAAGLQLYNALAPKARVARTLLMLGLRGAIVQPLLSWRGCVIGGAPPPGRASAGECDDVAIERAIARLLARDDIHLTIDIGESGEARKPVMLIASGRGQVLGFAKIGWNAPTRRLVRHEADVLADLRRASTLRGRVPGVLARLEGAGRTVVVQTPLHGARRPGPTRLTREHLEILVALNRRMPTRTALVGSEAWRDVAARVSRLAAGERREEAAVAARALRWLEDGPGREALPFGWKHGDFAPWNTKRSPRGLCVFDWESAAPVAPPAWDLFHFIIQAGGLLRRWGAKLAYAELMSGAPSVWIREYFDALDLAPSLVRPLLVFQLVDVLATSASTRDASRKEERHRALRVGLLHLLLADARES